MKYTRILFVMTFLCIVATVNAQELVDKSAYTDQGRILLGTSTGFSFVGIKIKDVDEQLLAVNVDLNAGYFVVKNLVVGLLAGYEFGKFGDTKDWSYNAGLFARYYTKPKIFAGAGYLMSQGKEGDVIGIVPVEVGYAHFFNKTFALEPSLFFGIGANNNDTFSYAFTIGFGIYLN